MYTFNVTFTNNNTIEVLSNTYWSCKAEGNFMLSKYYGEGNASIEVIIPEDISVAEGVVTFSYGDERCSYPEYDIYFTNNCYIKTNPSYVNCGEGENKEKTIFFFFEEPKETFYVSVECFDGWMADSTDFNYITSNNDVMIIASGKEGELRIIPTHNCSGKSIVHVKLIDKNKK